MRTTLTLEPELAQRLKDLAHQRRTSFKSVVNDTIRAGLSAQAKPRPERRPFEVKPFDTGGFRPGVDPARLNQHLDDIEAEEWLGKQVGGEE